MDTFNCESWKQWFYGSISRTSTEKKLLGQPEGTFLIRESSTIEGDLVLSVSENLKVSHYIVNISPDTYKIGDLTFPSITELLVYYKIHYLDTTSLRFPLTKQTIEPQKPAMIQVNRYSTGMEPQQMQQGLADQAKVYVQGVFDFVSDDPDDLPFRKGDILEVIDKPEENWWTAKNNLGKIGQIPVPYIGTLAPGRNSIGGNYQLPPMQGQAISPGRPMSMPTSSTPVFAKVVTRRVGNAYDSSSLSLEVGDIVTVTKMNQSGQWEGECKGKKGFFPFTHVKIIDSPNQAS